MINIIYYQTQQGLKRKISRLVFKLFPGKHFALSKYAPVTLHYFPATAILNETPVFAAIYRQLIYSDLQTIIQLVLSHYSCYHQPKQGSQYFMA